MSETDVTVEPKLDTSRFDEAVKSLVDATTKQLDLLKSAFAKLADIAGVPKDLTALASSVSGVVKHALEAQETIQNAMSQLAGAIAGKAKDMASTLLESFAVFKDGAILAFRLTGEEAAKQFSGVIDKAKGVVTSIQEVALSKATQVGEAISKIASPFVSVFGKAKSAVVSLFSGIGDAIAKKFEPITSKLGPIFSTFTSAMGTAASDAVGVITKKFSGISEKVGGALSATLSGIGSAAGGMSKGITAATAGVA